MGALDGKRCLITGAGNGIGKASAMVFSAKGAKVTVADFDIDAARAVACEIVKNGGSAMALAVDVTDEASVDEMIGQTTGTFGGLDVLFTCAGGGSTQDGAVTDLELDEFWRTIRVDLYGTLLCCRRAIPEMVASGGGSVITMASLRAVIGTEGADAYTASKGGILSMSRAMAMQWAAKNIRVNTLAPGVVLTERVAAFIKPDNPIYRKSLLRPSEPEDVANLAAFLASDASRKITGTVQRLDGGASAY